MRHPSWLLRSLLFLLLGGGVVACYEPVDLVSSEEVLVPCVHCILNDSDTQYLSMHYLSKDNRPGPGIDRAEVTFFEYYPMQEGGTSMTLARKYPFESLGDGKWRLVFPNDWTIKKGAPCRLQVVLPSGDTLRAETTMVGSDGIGNNRGIKVVFPTNPDQPDYALSLHGYPAVISTEVFGPYELHRPHFVILPSAGTVWVYKIGWSNEEDGWFLEKELATDREDLTDGFNRTGKLFTQSRDPLAQESYPEVVGKPLHYQFLRIPYRGTADTIAISGDFSGRHYGMGGSYGDLMAAHEQFIIATIYVEHMKQGLPYEEPPRLINGKVGKVVFKTVSAEYDRYLNDVIQYHLLHDVGTDIIAIYDNNNIYSNIDGGVGVFGSESETSFYWTCGTWNL